MLEAYMVETVSSEDDIETNHALQYVDYLSRHNTYEVVVVEPGMAYKYQGNFYGLLKELGRVPVNAYLYALYINGLTNPNNFDGEAKSIKIPLIPPIPGS